MWARGRPKAVALGVRHHAGGADHGVEGFVGMAVDPDVRRPQRSAPIVRRGRHQRRQVAWEGRGQDVVGRRRVGYLRRVMRDDYQRPGTLLAKLIFQEGARSPVPGQRMRRPEALHVSLDPDLLEIVHPLGGDRHGALPVAQQFVVGPEGPAKVTSPIRGT